MTNAVQVFPPGFRLTDVNGVPVSGGQIKFFAAGTTNPKTVYSDENLVNSLGAIVYTRSDGAIVTQQNGSTITAVYTDVADYKVEITDVNSVDIFPALDFQKGAVNLQPGGTPTNVVPVQTITGTVTLDATYNGKLVRGNTTGANVIATLPAAATAGNGWWVRIKKVAQANVCTIQTQGIDSIDGLASIALMDNNDCLDIHCDGGSFYVGQARIATRQRAIGDIRISSVAGARTGELECNGQAVSRTTYATLFAAIGIQHGQGDGATTFNLPFYSGRAFRVWDHGAGVDPDASGRTAPNTGGNVGDNPGSVQADQVGPHTHDVKIQFAAPLSFQSGGASALNHMADGDANSVTYHAASGNGALTTGTTESRGKNVGVAAYILALTF